jgi:hemerythrin superfamily protein
MKVTVLLRNDHEALRVLFDRFKKAGVRSQSGNRDLGEIQKAIRVHSQMESEIFYPALASTSSTEAQLLVSTAQGEHESVERLIDELNGMNAQDRNFEAKADELIDAVTRHMEKEEEVIFDEARRKLPEYRLEELGLEMEIRLKILSQLAA